MTQQGTNDDLAAALRELCAGQEADGYRVLVRWHDGRVELQISATPEACVDCLTPKGVLVGIAAAMLNGAGLPFTEADIDIAYPDRSAQS
jgi:hypothetical protein